MAHGLHYRRKLGRPPKHRRAMLRNLVTSLFKHERIETTVARAKETRKYAEKMITYGKRGTRHAFVKVAAFVREKEAIRKVFTDYRRRYALRPGGYTRIIRTRFRYGDAAPMAYLELIDRPGELVPSTPCEPNHQQNQIIRKRYRQQFELERDEKEEQEWRQKQDELTNKLHRLYPGPHADPASLVLFKFRPTAPLPDVSSFTRPGQVPNTLRALFEARAQKAQATQPAQPTQ